MAYIGRTPTNSILTGADIADGSISTAKIADNAIVTGKITDGTIATGDIADSAVTAVKTSGLGNPIFIKKATNSSSATTVSLTGCFSTTYDYYLVYIYADIITANGDLLLNFLKDTSTDFTGNNLNGSLFGERGTTSPTHYDNGGVASSTTLKLASNDIHNGAGSAYIGQLQIANPFNRTNKRMHIKASSMGDGSGGVLNSVGAWVYSGTEVATGLKLSSGSGSSRFGVTEINVYGIV